MIRRNIILLAVVSCMSTMAFSESTFTPIGVAKIDITPNESLRLSGYAARQTVSAGVSQPIWAKALAIGDDEAGPALALTVDNVAVPDTVRDELLFRLQQKTAVRDETLAVCSTHTHSAPCLAGATPNLFGYVLPNWQQQAIERYTAWLIDRLEEAALAALADRKPAQLSMAVGKAEFAANRRTDGGPVDHQLPMLQVTDADGNIRAVWTTYACHCTTLDPSLNQVNGDWAGYAQEYLEADHPGAIALVSLGCGADANPSPRGKLEQAQAFGRAIADEFKRLKPSPFRPISGRVTCRTKFIRLNYDTLPTREQWMEKLKVGEYMGFHAKKNLDRLDAGDPIPRTLHYLVQTWTFGNDLAMVMLPGEVVVDYALRLRNELDPERLWVHGYTNDVPGYIPSERILQEGGYEGGEAMIYFDRPNRFAPGVEQAIVSTVHELLPDVFRPKPLR